MIEAAHQYRAILHFTACASIALAGATGCTGESHQTVSEQTQSSVGKPLPWSESDTVIDHRGLNVRYVHADTLIANDDLETVTNPTLLNSQLWLLNVYNAPFFHVVDTASGRLIASLGRVGQGPGEFEHPNSIIVASEGDTTAWVWDSGLSRLTRVTLAQLMNTSRSPIDIVQTKVREFWLSPRGKAGFLSNNGPNENYFTLFAENGEVIGHVDITPAGSKDIELMERRQSLNGATVCPTWDRSGFALTYPYAGRIQMYDSLAILAFSFKVPYPDSEVFVPSQRERKTVLRRSRDFYRSCAFSRDRLFAVFSGKQPAGNRYENDYDDGANYIHVFDLKGELIEVLRVDRTISDIAVDAEGKRAFATSFRNTVVYRISLR